MLNGAPLLCPDMFFSEPSEPMDCTGSRCARSDERERAIIIRMTNSVIFLGCSSKTTIESNDRCTSPRVFQIDRVRPPLGPCSWGVLGDFRRWREPKLSPLWVVKASPRFSVTGGNLIDLAQQRAFPADHLNQVTLYLQDEFPRQATYKKLESSTKEALARLPFASRWRGFKRRKD